MKTNIKIMRTRPLLSDEDIQSHMNFEEVVTKAQVSNQKRRFTRRILYVAVPLAAGLSATLYFLGQDTQPVALQSTKPQVQQEQPALIKQAPLLDSGLVRKQEPVREVKEKAKKAVQTIDPKAKEETPISDPVPAYVEAEPVEGFPNLYR